MDWIRRHLRQLRWQLTLSYTAVTVISLLAIVMIVASVFFSQILLPDYVFTPQDWVDIASEQSQFPLGYLLSEDPIDPEVFINIYANVDPVIVSQKLFLFSDLEIYARSTGVIDFLVTDSAGRLVYVSRRNRPFLLQDIKAGEQFDPDLIPGLAGPLEAALQGRSDADSVFQEFKDGDGFLMAFPVFHPEISDKVVGAMAYVIRDISTPQDRGRYSAIVFLRSLVIVLLAATLVGAIFGGLTAEALASRFRRLASASEDWSRGDFTTRIHDESSDEIGQLAGRLDGMAEELQELVQKRQELAVTEERSRLARDLHDSAKQLALAASFQIATARQLFERDPRSAANSLEEAENLIDKVRIELTDLIHELRPTQKDGRDFNEVVHTYAAEWAHSSGIGVQLDIQEVEKLPLEAEEALYRIMQEALANVARHSGASQAYIQIQQQNSEIKFSVRDDGSGFDGAPSTSGLGLFSMQERAEAIGGKTNITSQPGIGTEVRVILPLVKKEAEND
jgi:NarL family two-component system sensor histidine kinase LiaS